MGLMTQAGGETVQFADVEVVETPTPTRTHYPLSHAEFVTTVKDFLSRGGFEIQEERHALSHEGSRYFGVLNIGGPNADKPIGYNWVIGLRNSHDKAFSAGVAAGSNVLVCDNLCFNGEVRVARKHTRFAEQDLNRLISGAVGKLGGSLQRNDQRYENYRAYPLSLKGREVNDIMIRALDSGVTPASRIPAILENWRKPPQDEWTDERNAWGLFNAFTADFKRVNDPGVLLKRGESLHGLMDSLVGFN
jgi:hypothetical protein